MKIKNTVIAAFYLCSSLFAAKAQMVDLHNFADTTGSYSQGSLLLSGALLFGTTEVGGTNNLGTVFSIDTTGANYKVLHNFSGADGQNPFYEKLVLSGTTLYGTAFAGGASNYGVVFSIDTNGSSYSVVYSFNGTQGESPSGGLILSGTTLYGTTEVGTSNPNGYIFSLQTNGSGYTPLHSFTGSDGQNPVGSLVISGSMLFGMTPSGAKYGDGDVFSIQINGTAYKDILDFKGTSNGSNPEGSLILAGKTLIGMTSQGGANSLGCAFTLDTSGSVFGLLYNFTNASGSKPKGTLILHDTVLYGMTNSGGASNWGTIFAINMISDAYKSLYSFNGAVGQQPVGDLLLNNGIMYGMTPAGGANGWGVIFAANPNGLGIHELHSDSAQIKVYPNPNNGVFTIQWSPQILNYGISNGKRPIVKVYNAMGEEVKREELQSNNEEIDLSTEPNGFYLFRITDEQGNLLGQGKFVILR